MRALTLLTALLLVPGLAAAQDKPRSALDRAKAAQDEAAAPDEHKIILDEAVDRAALAEQEG